MDMGGRLLPLSLPELYAHALVLERESAQRFDQLARYMRDTGVDHLAEEFERIGKEEREQYELLDGGTVGRLPELKNWEYAWHYTGAAQSAAPARAPRGTHDALELALSLERRVEAFYSDVAENAEDEAVSALAAEMAADERRHVERLERLLEREPLTLAEREEDDERPAARRLAS
jgi:rubrerythrin